MRTCRHATRIQLHLLYLRPCPHRFNMTRDTRVSVLHLSLELGLNVKRVSPGWYHLLTEAVLMGKKSQVHLLIQYNADIAYSNVRSAVWSDSLEILDALIAAGAHVDIPEQSVKDSALSRAISYRSVAFVSRLLSAGAILPRGWNKLMDKQTVDRVEKIAVIQEHLQCSSSGTRRGT